MAEAEILELIFIAGSTALTAFGLFITFTFAYLTVAYFVGPGLSKNEVAIISVLYVISALMTFSVVMANVSAMDSLQQEMSGSAVYQRISFFMDANIYSSIVPVVCMLGIGVSLKFMWSVRHPKAE